MNVFRVLMPCALHYSGDDHRNNIQPKNVGNYWFTDCAHNYEKYMTRRMGTTVSNFSAHGGDSVTADRFLNSGNVNSTIIVRERRKRVAGFATLRKKFIRKRRSSKNCDHGRMIRQVISTWNPAETVALLQEYEALAALKDLHVQAELARPPAPTFKQDLSSLYDYKFCTDVDLVYRGTCFPVHRAVLSVRCPYFRDLFMQYPGSEARICLELPSHDVDVSIFSALLRYLYTGDEPIQESTIDVNFLQRLGNEFGNPHSLEYDLRYLLNTGNYADAALVFTSEHDIQRPDSGNSEYGFRPKLELPCHKAILSARSLFFRNLIQRRSRSNQEHGERSLHTPTRIVLDESVIPKRYAYALLHAVYLDTVDLSLILRGTAYGNNLINSEEDQSLTHIGRERLSSLEEAMELYQIGRFLELDILSQGCEDLILECLTIDSLPTVLKWGDQPHGSAWVYRQALHFLREEFQPISVSPVLHQLDQDHLAIVLQSHFLQASELEILQAVLKWGEYELLRRMEDREPNLLSHMVHSVARKGGRKRDLCDIELRDILSRLLPFVRLEHVLPRNNEILLQAVRRGLVPGSLSSITDDERGNLKCNMWIRGGNKNGLFIQPRLFMPYYEEIKALAEEEMLQRIGIVRSSRYIPDIPDALYMLDEKPCVTETSGVDVLAVSFSVPDSAIMSSMFKREQKLRESPSCQKALSLPLSSTLEINRLLRLRVVREFNLPDAVADLLESKISHSSTKLEERNSILSHDTVPTCFTKNNGPELLNFPSATLHSGRNMTFPRHSISSNSQRYELPAVVTEGRRFKVSTQNFENNSCSDSYLSGIMPDVAIATASLGALQLAEHQHELELDLGDGTSHLTQHNLCLENTNDPVIHHYPHSEYNSERHYNGVPQVSHMYHHPGSGLPRFM